MHISVNLCFFMHLWSLITSQGQQSSTGNSINNFRSGRQFTGDNPPVNTRRVSPFSGGVHRSPFSPRPFRGRPLTSIRGGGAFRPLPRNRNIVGPGRGRTRLSGHVPRGLDIRAPGTDTRVPFLSGTIGNAWCSICCYYPSWDNRRWQCIQRFCAYVDPCSNFPG